MTSPMMEDAEREHWIRSGHAMFNEFMQRVEKIDRVGVKGMDESSEEKRVTLIDKRKVYASLEEIADMYVNDEKKLVLDFTESKAMAVFHSPSVQHPMEYIGFRWSYYKTPSRLVRSQDFFYLETMKPFVDVYGRRGWAKCSHSIEHPMCPESISSRDINRGRLYYSGVVFVEGREKGVLETTFYYSLDTTKIPAFLLPIVMKARGKNNTALINHYVKLARVTAYAGRTNVKKLKQQLVDEKRCGACSNPMPRWSSKTKCDFCKSYVCKRCCEIVSKNYLFDGEHACNSCMLCAETQGSKITSIMDDGESSSSTTEDARVEDVETPSSTASSSSSHRHGVFASNPQRCNSMPASAHRPPAKLLDFGLGDLDLAIKKHEAPAAAARSISSASTASSAASQPEAPAPRAAQRTAMRSQSAAELIPPMSAVKNATAVHPTPAQQQQSFRRGSREPAAPSPSQSPSDNLRQREREEPRRVPSRRHIERPGSSPHLHGHQHHLHYQHNSRHPLPPAPTPHGPRPRHHRPRHSSEDLPSRAKQIAYTRENPCDLSYLSAFKV